MDIIPFFESLYKNFNDRQIDLVVANMTAGVEWANGMDGGFVYGHDGVRNYWTRQFAQVSSHVTPLEIHPTGNVVTLTVHQVVHDLEGNLLNDAVVCHRFTMEHDKIARFEIVDAEH